jgi:Flp pilus assembly protein TadD
LRKLRVPTIAEALNLAEQALRANDLARASAIYEQVLKAAPGDAGALNGLGVVAFRSNRLEEAADYHRRAIAARSDNPAFFNNLNLVYCRLGRAAEAVDCCRRAVALAPQTVELRNNLGTALKQCGRLDEAAASFRQAIALRPDYGDAHYNLANALVLLGKLDEAEAEYQRALELAPSDAEVRYNHALLRLLRGELAEGWRGLEWRFSLPGFRRPNFPQPRWQGEPLAGRTILLVGEQGMGDCVQMIRFARILKQSGATVLVQCRPALHALLRTTQGIDRFVEPGRASEAAFDYYIPLLSLPGALGLTLETIPAEVPYLSAERARVESWREKIGPSSDFKVGIAWQGSPDYVLDVFRSIPLAEFAPLAACPAVKLFSLQKGHGREQLAAVGQTLGIVDLGASLDEEGAAFVDTAAAMMCLDLVITSDTAVAHVAAALGRPVWVALAHVPDWRWLLVRNDSPWYPTMRLVRQSRQGDWREVFQRMAADLASRGKP